MTDTQKEREPAARRPRDATVLIVDDEELLRETVSFDFRRQGYNVLTAGCGNDAIALLEKHHVDVVISDVRMPNGSGIELLDYVRKKHASLPVVIFATGFTDLSLEEAYDRGADAVFPKPFDRKALQETVLRAIQPSNARYNRGSVRVDVEIGVDLERSSGQKLPDAQILNFGRGGFFVNLREHLPQVGEVLQFAFASDPEEKPRVQGTGLVRWVRSEQGGVPAGCGIEIVKLDEESRRKFIALVNSAKTGAFLF